MVHEHPVFRMGTRDEVERCVRFFDELEPAVALEDGVIGLMIRDASGANSWARVVVILNGGREAKQVHLPEGGWCVAVCDGAHEDGARCVVGAIDVGAHSGAVLYEAR